MTNSIIEPNNFFIVAIGASAGGLQALESFFSNLPDHPNAAFVVVQHLSPDYKSMMTEILQRKTFATSARLFKEHQMYAVTTTRL